MPRWSLIEELVGSLSKAALNECGIRPAGLDLPVGGMASRLVAGQTFFCEKSNEVGQDEMTLNRDNIALCAVKALRERADPISCPRLTSRVAGTLFLAPRSLLG